MRKAIALTTVTFALAVSGLFAQAPAAGNRGNFIQRRVTHLTTVLGLSAGQQQQATNIFTEAASANSAMRGNMKSARQALQQAVQNNDSAGIEQAANTIGVLTGQSQNSNVSTCRLTSRRAASLP